MIGRQHCNVGVVSPQHNKTWLFLVLKKTLTCSNLHLLSASLCLNSDTSTDALGRDNHIELTHLLVNLSGKLVHVGGIYGGDVATTYGIGKERFE